MIDYRVNKKTRTLSLTATWETITDDEYILLQASAAVRVTWGTDDAIYFTYAAMTTPILLPSGFRIRAETTATLVLVGVQA